MACYCETDRFCCEVKFSACVILDLNRMRCVRCVTLRLCVWSAAAAASRLFRSLVYIHLTLWIGKGHGVFSSCCAMRVDSSVLSPGISLHSCLLWWRVMWLQKNSPRSWCYSLCTSLWMWSDQTEFCFCSVLLLDNFCCWAALSGLKACVYISDYFRGH